ncbi:hypothetical protein [Streptosporangium sp. NPDC051022]|uniref:hypothetical protein n=1 Tax=Streptosporangium sp. NPDC051022 TaxID=3155752 RepID=UPI0034244F37
MPSPDRAFEARRTALHAAAVLHGPLVLQPGIPRDDTARQAQKDIRALADQLAAYVLGAAHISLVPGPVLDEATGLPSSTTQQKGDKMQINTGQKFSIKVTAKDAAGYPTAADFQLSVDNPDVVSLTQDEDGTWWVISGAPGESVVTGTVQQGEGQEPLTARLVVDVVPAGAATVEFEVGDIVEENAASTPGEGQ